VHAFLGKQFRSLATLIIKNFFLISSLDLPSFSLNPLHFVLSLEPLVESLSLSFLNAPFKYHKAAVKSPQSFLFSRLNQPSSQLFFVGEVFHPPDLYMSMAKQVYK